MNLEIGNFKPMIWTTDWCSDEDFIKGIKKGIKNKKYKSKRSDVEKLIEIIESKQKTIDDLHSKENFYKEVLEEERKLTKELIKELVRDGRE